MKYYIKYTIITLLIICVGLIVLFFMFNSYQDPYLMSCDELNSEIKTVLHSDGGFGYWLKTLMRAAVEKHCVIG